MGRGRKARLAHHSLISRRVAKGPSRRRYRALESCRPMHPIAVHLHTVFSLMGTYARDRTVDGHHLDDGEEGGALQMTGIISVRSARDRSRRSTIGLGMKRACIFL